MSNFDHSALVQDINQHLAPLRVGQHGRQHRLRLCKSLVRGGLRG